MTNRQRRFRLGVGAGVFIACLSAGPAHGQPCYVLNVPRMAPKPEADREWIGDRHDHHRNRAGIAWFGLFDEHANYAEVRVIADPDGLDIHIHVADLHVWWIMDNGLQWGGELMAELERWEGLEVAIDPADLGPDPGSPGPTGGALRFLVANYPYNDPVAFPETAVPHKCTRTHRGTSGGWEEVADPDTSGRIWYHALGSSWNEDPGPNDNTTQFDNGTIYRFFVPWTSLGMDQEPPSGGMMKMMVRLYDIDDPADSEVTGMDPPPSARGSTQQGPLAPAVWPPEAAVEAPSTWGTLILYQAPYRPPEVTSEQTVELGPGDVTMRDVTVGGHSFIEDRWISGGGDPADFAWPNCMETRFGQAGELLLHPEGGPTHMCFFSRVLFHYDLAGVVPDGHVVTSATLRLFHFGGDSNEHPGDPNFEVRTSPVQVHRLEGAWQDLPLDQGVTWNTAPLAAENVGFGEVTPEIPDGDPPGKYVTFDLTPMVARAVLRNESLNVALYGADTTANTGKYFVASEGGWTDQNKPTLTVTYGPPVDPGSIPSAEGCTLGVAESLFDPPGTGTPDDPRPPGTLPDAGTPSSSGRTSGCGCRSGPKPGPAQVLFFLLLVTGLLGRRGTNRSFGS